MPAGSPVATLTHDGARCWPNSAGSRMLRRRWLAEPKAVDAYGTKPGHGYGDKNHYHSGPPGQNKQD
jgi:hypothetical protein